MKLSDTFKRFAKSEQFGGILLIVCTVVSLALANSPIGANWLALWHAPLGPLSAEHWVNDALMAIFFLLIGLELERELLVGELSDFRSALLPLFAAVGGMAAPALIHYSTERGQRHGGRGSGSRWRPISRLRSASLRCSGRGCPPRSRFSSSPTR
jgi:NhaA family Na+:H+ antiporter